MRRLLLVLAGLLVAAPVTTAEEGPKAADLVKKMKDRDAAVRLAAVRDAAKRPDPGLTSQIVRLVKDGDALVRQAAIEALRGRTEDGCRKKAAQALAARLPILGEKPGYWDEYVLAISVLHDLARPESIEKLVDMKVDEDRETVRSRLMAVANVPKPEAVDELIKFMSKGRGRGRKKQRDLAHQALRYATGENLGGDPDKWRSWWKKARGTFDFEEAAARRAEQRERERKKKEQREEKERKRREKGEKRKKKDE
ncbi:MAG: HEAT repeat domain-containing protein [Planctomycetota bacterium]